jgi:hypothetical protein
MKSATVSGDIFVGYGKALKSAPLRVDVTG